MQLYWPCYAFVTKIREGIDLIGKHSFPSRGRAAQYINLISRYTMLGAEVNEAIHIPFVLTTLNVRLQ